jgi:integrase
MRESLKVQDKRVGRLQGHNMTFEEFVREIYWKHPGIRESTATDYRSILNNHILPRVRNRKLIDLSETDWENILENCQDSGDLSNARVNRIHAVASAVYSKAIKKKYAQLNPLTLVDYLESGITDFDYWSDEEVTQFLDYCRLTNHPRYLLYWLAYETGMRVSELIALKWDSVDFNCSVISVRRSYDKHTRQVLDTTKSGKPRTLGINPELKLLLKSALDEHRSKFVFCRKNGEHLSYDALYDQFKADQVAAHMRPIGIHDIRHTYASHYVMGGGLIYDLKELLGHADIGTTMRYAHFSLFFCA